MMIFSVFDEKADAFLVPFFSRNENTAIRDITRAVNEPGHGFYENAEDYSLWCVGEWEEDKGTIEGLQRSCITQLHALIDRSFKLTQEAEVGVDDDE